jgi:8-oxo-dGTP pyrophosphatase MutT (NUDIX family)
MGGDVGVGGDVGGGGLEVYLLRRAGTMAFAAGMHVFPGGSVDPRDGDAGTAWAGPSPAEWGRRLGCEDQLARALVCAAVRETFEESGVLLAGPSADEVVADTTAEDWEADRQALLDRSFAMSQLLARRGLVLRSDLLAAFAHWITPEFEPRRFDTRFFAAALPAGQRARDVSGEADHATWVGVGAAVRAHEAGEMAMLPPTIAALRDLSAYPDVAAALAAPRRLRPILPRLVETDGALRLVVE